MIERTAVTSRRSELTHLAIAAIAVGILIQEFVLLPGYCCPVRSALPLSVRAGSTATAMATPSQAASFLRVTITHKSAYL
jgi:hypothetical protein